MKIEIYRDVDEDKPPVNDPAPDPNSEPKPDKPVKKSNAGLIVAIVVIAIIVISVIIYFYGKAKREE